MGGVKEDEVEEEKEVIPDAIDESQPLGQEIIEEEEPRKCWDRFSTPGVLLTCLSLVWVFTTVPTYALLPSSISTLETRYGFSSKTIAFLSMAFRIAYLLSVIPITHCGRRRKLRTIMIGSALASIGAFVMTIPHFISPAYVYTGGTPDGVVQLCGASLVPDLNNCNYNQELVFWIFVVGETLCGIGAVPCETLSLPLLDQIVPKPKRSLYFAAFFVILLFGPLVGYALSAFWLSTWVDPGISPYGVYPKDKGWVGAWWIPFIFIGSLCALFTLSLLVFSEEELIDRERDRRAREKETRQQAEESGLLAAAVGDRYDSDSYDSDAGEPHTVSPPKIKGPTAFQSLKALLQNGPYVLAVLGMVIHGLPTAGMSVFFAKAITSIFFVTASTASMVLAAMGPVGVLGIGFGGWFLKRIKATTADNAKWIVLFNITGAIFGLSLLIGCGTVSIAGVNTQYLTPATQSSQITASATNTSYLMANCNRNCGCRSHEYHPVCGSDGMSYFSPCHAGCGVEVNRGADDWNNRAFTECTCVSIVSGGGGGAQSSQPSTLGASAATPVNAFASLGSAGGGICASGNCQAGLLGFAGLFFAGSFFSFSSTVARTNVLLRSVEPKYRPMAIALKNALLVMCTTLPAPLVYGWAIDKSCILWDNEGEQCGGTTNCLEYDNWKMRIDLCLLAVLPNAASVAFYFFAFKLLKDRGFVTGDDNIEESLSVQGGERSGRHREQQVTPIRGKRGQPPPEVDQDPLLSGDREENGSASGGKRRVEKL